MFLKDADFEAFERTIQKTLETRPIRICGLKRFVAASGAQQPYGHARGVEKIALQLGMESTLRSRGRPRKDPT